MNLKEYKERYGFNSPEEKYKYVKNSIKKNLILRFVFRRYYKRFIERLKRYSHEELENLEDKL